MQVTIYVVRVILQQQRNKIFRGIYYVSQTLDSTQQNYTTAKNKMLVMVFTINKFGPYRVKTKIIVFADHADIRDHFAKQDAKPQLI